MVPYAINLALKLNLCQNKRGYLILIKMTLLFAQRINRVIFLLFQNNYFNIENTLTHTNTASLNPFDAQTSKSEMKSSMRMTLRLIGAIKCLTILIQLFNEVKFLHENKLKSNNITNGNVEVTQIKRSTSNINCGCCLLCLDEINGPTSAMCGHIFCYTCIQAYIKSNSQRDEMTKCPSCRQQIDQNKLIYLHNF